MIWKQPGRWKHQGGNSLLVKLHKRALRRRPRFAQVLLTLLIERPARQVGAADKHLRRNRILEHPARCRYGQKERAANLDNACAVARLSVWNHGCSRIIIIDADVGRA